MWLWGTLLQCNLKVAWINPSCVRILQFLGPRLSPVGPPSDAPRGAVWACPQALQTHPGTAGCPWSTQRAQRVHSSLSHLHCPEPNSPKTVLSPAHGQDKAAASWRTWDVCDSSQTCFSPLHRITAVEQEPRFLKAGLCPPWMHELDLDLLNPNYYS